MVKGFAGLLIMFPIVSCSFAQPVISAIVNSASWRTQGLPGSGIAQGSIFTILGNGMGPDPWLNAGPLPLATTLGHTSVTVNVGGKSVNALIQLTYNWQINAVLPSGTPAGNGTITVTYNGQTSAPFQIQVAGGAFGIYTFNSSGYGQAIATDTNYQVNTIIKTFHPGDYGILWGTGLGAIDGDDAAAPPVGDLPGPIMVHIGNTTVDPYYAGRSASFPGLDQVVFQVPAGVEGCYVPVAVETAGTVSNIATIAVSSSGQTCTDSVMGQDLVEQLAAGNKVDFGYVRLESLFYRYGFYSGTAGGDFLYGTFSEFTPQTAGLAVYGVSQGYCVAGSGGGVGLSDLSPSQLNAGAALTVQGQGTMTVPNTYGFYRAYSSASKFLWSGLNYTVSGPSGKDVGAFSITEKTSTGSAAFTGLSAGQTVPLSGDLPIQWTGGDSNMQNAQVTIEALSQDSSGSLVAWVQCTAPASAHSFTIPGWVLSQLPVSGSGQTGSITYPLGVIWIGQYNNPVTFRAQGLDRGIVRDAFFSGLGIYFQ